MNVLNKMDSISLENSYNHEFLSPEMIRGFMMFLWVVNSMFTQVKEY